MNWERLKSFLKSYSEFFVMNKHQKDKTIINFIRKIFREPLFTF